MTETPDRHDGDDTTPDGARPDAWQAPHASERHAHDEQPTVEVPGHDATRPLPDAAPVDTHAAPPSASSHGDDNPTDRIPFGAPPLPGTTPGPISQQGAASEQGIREPGHQHGVHRAPPSLDHAPYAGAQSAAFGNLAAAADPGVGEQAHLTGDGSGYSYDSSNATAAGGWRAPASPRRQRRGLGAFVAVAVVAAVIGALVATGGYAVFASRTSTSAGSTPNNLTIGHYKDATVITAVAAKATQSVVTINVSSGTSAGTGSGVILTDDGYIVTNTHVVTLDGASSTGTVNVTMSNGTIFSGRVVGTDPLVDLAVIKINATGLKPITFADSSKLNVGDTAVAIGAPLGLSNTVTDGIVSTLNRSITVQSSAVPDSGDNGSGNSQDNNGQGPFSFDNGQNGSSQATATISLPVIQTDASINPGNSGGALLNSQGDLIGVNVAIASAGGSSSSSSAAGSIGVGFSIPANLVKRITTSIIDSGSATHGLLGASVDDATSASNAKHTGALIKSLTSGGAAEKAGLRAGDVVTAFDGVQITGATDITAQVRTLAGGATASITYLRNGQSKTTTVTLGTLKG